MGLLPIARSSHARLPLVLTLALGCIASHAAAATFTVTNTLNGGPGSLRQAIVDANATLAADTIVFRIPATDPNFDGAVCTIRPTAPLPVLTQPVTIDGGTQTTFTGNTNGAGPEVQLGGTLAGATANGLSITAGGCLVRGLLINGFARDGILIRGATANGNSVQSCFVGTDATGLAAGPNGSDGIEISGGAGASGTGGPNVIGGGDRCTRNVLAGNTLAGVRISGAGSDCNVVQGNFLGLDATGTAALPNGGEGVRIGGGAQSNTIGGLTVGARNVISGNTLAGVRLADLGTNSNMVQGNFIGTHSGGRKAIANGGDGVLIIAGASSNTIGGVGSGAANRIGFNSGDGVRVADDATGSSQHNALQRNAIFGNAGLGINLQPLGEAAKTVTPNDPPAALDADNGPNALQNAPLLRFASVASDGSATLSGTLDSAAATTYTLEFFRAAGADASGFGEGERFLKSQSVTTDAAGHAAFSFAISAATGLTAGQYVSATATSAPGDTSEFSNAKRALAATLTLSVNPASFSEAQTSTLPQATLARNTDPATALTVTIVSADPSEATVPPTVVIPAGRGSVTFTVTPVDDGVADGDQTFNIKASRAGYAPGVASVTVQDNE